MLGWSIMANAWRSASNRAMTWRVSMPSLMILSATLRRIGLGLLCHVDYGHTPSPIFSSSLYRPITVPGPSDMGDSSGTIPFFEGGNLKKALARSWAASKAFNLCPQFRFPAAGLLQVCESVFSLLVEACSKMGLIRCRSLIEAPHTLPVHQTMRNPGRSMRHRKSQFRGASL